MTWGHTSTTKRVEDVNNVSKVAVTRKLIWNTLLWWKRLQVVHQKSSNNSCHLVKVIRILLCHLTKWQPNKFLSLRVLSERKLKRSLYSQMTKVSSYMVDVSNFSIIEIIQKLLQHHLGQETHAWMAILDQEHIKMVNKWLWLIYRQ